MHQPDKPYHSRRLAFRLATLGRLLLGAGLVLALGPALLLTRFLLQARRSLPVLDGRHVVRGLSAPVEVLRDAAGVPHINATTASDLFFGQGYVTAQDRLWQLEFNRRTAAGRLSEVFGPASVDADRLFRLMGLARAAALEEATLAPEVRASIQAYCDGVNAYVSAHRGRLPAEFSLLRVTFAPWRPADCLAWSKMMAWQLSGNWSSELLRAQLMGKLGPERAAELMPSVPPGQVPHVPSEVQYAGLGLSLLRLMDRVFGLVRPAAGELGSNNWVVAGFRSASGRPLLANDTHLDVQHPATWYEVHLAGGGFDVAGFALPGTPGVIVGHNASLAWGVTNVGADVQDLFVERRHPDNPALFLYQDKWEEAEMVHEEIKVRGWRRPLAFDVPWTRHGPVLNADQQGEEPLALRWTALQATPVAASILALDRAENWQQFRAALADFAVPSQYFVYADVEGHIGLQVPGAVPVRGQGDGLLPVPGWTGEYEWQGFVPFSQLPSSFDPEDGLLVTANNRTPAVDGRPTLTYEWLSDHRAERIRELLAGDRKLTIADLQQVQLDIQSGLARAVTPVLLAALDEERAVDGVRSAAHEILRHWDYETQANSAAALLFHAFYNCLLRNVFADELGPELFRYYATNSRHHVLALQTLLLQPEAAGPGSASRPARARRDDTLRRSWREGVAAVSRRFGPDPAAWRWGQVHTLRFVTPLSRVPLLGRWLNRGPYSVAGGPTTVNVAGYDFVAPYGVTHHPALRFVVDLANWDASVAVIPTGESGHFFSSHYDDQLDRWLAGRSIPLPFSAAAVAAAASHRLLLVPASEGGTNRPGERS